MDAALKWMKAVAPKRALALALGPGFLVLGADAAVDHLAGRAGMVVPAQYVPLLFAPAAAVAVMAVALPRVKAAIFARVLRGVGVAGMAVGAAGTFFHVRALGRLLEGGPLTVANLEAALAVAPPLFAPGAFLGVGAVLLALASRRVVVELQGAERVEPRVTPTRLQVGLPRQVA